MGSKLYRTQNAKRTVALDFNGPAKVVLDDRDNLMSAVMSGDLPSKHPSV